MASSYPFDILTSFPNGFCTRDLQKSIEASSISKNLLAILTLDKDCEFCFDADLDTAEETTLIGIANAHVPTESKKQYFKDNMSDRWFKYKFDSSAPLDILIPADYHYLLQGFYYVNPNQAGIDFDSDYVRLSIVDVDGTITGTPGTVLAIKVEKYLTEFDAENEFYLSNERADMPAGAYIRLELISSTGGIKCKTNLALSKKED